MISRRLRSASHLWKMSLSDSFFSLLLRYCRRMKSKGLRPVTYSKSYSTRRVRLRPSRGYPWRPDEESALGGDFSPFGRSFAHPDPMSAQLLASCVMALVLSQGQRHCTITGIFNPLAFPQMRRGPHESKVLRPGSCRVHGLYLVSLIETPPSADAVGWRQPLVINDSRFTLSLSRTCV